MMKAELAVGLEDLLGSGHGDGLDMRPTLLRVLTDLYLQRTAHTPEDERYYTELALRLIDATDIGTRSSLAERLATYPAAPRPLIERLARDAIEVAASILKHSSVLTAADRQEIARTFGGAHAEIIAGLPHGRSLPAPGNNRHARPGLAAAQAVELCQLFQEARSPERRLILINLDCSPLPPASPAIALQPADIGRLETAVLEHRTDALLREIERALGVTRAQARRIMSDPQGEPIVVAARALDLPTEVVQRMLLFINPAIGHSVRRVYELADLYGEISIEAARKLVAIWRKADPVGQAAPSPPSASWRTAAEHARRALAEISRRPQRPATRTFARRRIGS